jgi:prepilin-type N-terminal cleavage/methylation domain-containing protein
VKKGFTTPFVRAFTLIEVMVVVTLLSLIVLALMTVFNSTQRAFRASVTQSDVLEGGRAVMDLITEDVRKMSPSFGNSNNAVNGLGPVNFWVMNNTAYSSLHQSLVGVTDPAIQRTNIVESFFVLSSGNQNGVPTWYGAGYAVYESPTNLYSLYRFSTNRPMASANATSNLFYADFENFLNFPNNYSHLIDGVINLRVRAYDTNGTWMLLNQKNVTTNEMIFSGELIPHEVGYIFYSNALPASVEIEMATLEDRTLQRAESRPFGALRDTYLQNQSGAVHVFRQRVSILNVDPAAYQ